MSLRPCKECGHEVSTQALACPKCGAVGKGQPARRTSIVTWLVLGIIILAVIGAATAPTKPPPPPQTPAQVSEDTASKERFANALAGARTLKQAMRDPPSFTLDAVMQIGDAVCYGYRSRNGFNGMSSGQAVLLPKVSQLYTSEQPQFHKAWNKACGGKSADNIASILNGYL